MSGAQPNDFAAQPLVFVSKSSITVQIVLCIIGGVLCLGIVAVLMLLAIMIPATREHKIEPGFNTWFISQIWLSMMGIFAIWRAIFLLRMPRWVMVHGGGLEIHNVLSQQSLTWSEIGSITRGKRTSPYSKGFQTLEINNVAGRRRAVIADTIEGFEYLANELVNRSSAVSGHPTFDAQRNEEQTVAKKTRRLRKAAWIFLVMALGMAAAMIAGINEAWHTHRFATEGVVVDAKINNAWMYRVTPYVKYSFQDSAGHTFTRDAMMYQPDWELAHGNATIPVIYLRSAPDWNHLVRGEDTGPQFGGWPALIFAGGFVMCGLLSVFTFLGYDLEIEDGKNVLLRHGRVIKQWGTGSKSSGGNVPPPS
jgi:hypothetical protein